MDIRINTWNMHTPDDPTPTAKRRQTCTHPGTISATQTCMQCSNAWTMEISHNCKSDTKSNKNWAWLFSTIHFDPRNVVSGKHYMMLVFNQLYTFVPLSDLDHILRSHHQETVTNLFPFFFFFLSFYIEIFSRAPEAFLIDRLFMQITLSLTSVSWFEIYLYLMKTMAIYSFDSTDSMNMSISLRPFEAISSNIAWWYTLEGYQLIFRVL